MILIARCIQQHWFWRATETRESKFEWATRLWPTLYQKHLVYNPDIPEHQWRLPISKEITWTKVQVSSSTKVNRNMPIVDVQDTALCTTLEPHGLDNNFFNASSKRKVHWHHIDKSVRHKMDKILPWYTSVCPKKRKLTWCAWVPEPGIVLRLTSSLTITIADSTASWCSRISWEPTSLWAIELAIETFEWRTLRKKSSWSI